MSTCYFPIYNSATNEYEKHGLEINTFIGISGFCPEDPNHVILVSAFDGNTTDDLLNTSADLQILFANNSINTIETSSISLSEQDVDINTIIDDDIVNMNVNILITVINPVVKTDYKPLEKIKKINVVKQI